MMTSRAQPAPAPRRHRRQLARRALLTVAMQEDLNFLLTNRLPRRYATLLMAWLSRRESRLITAASIGLLRLVNDDLRLDEAKRARFASLRELFTRELRDGARPIDPDPRCVVSPCDGVVGAFGRVRDGQAIQAKGLWYPLAELVGARDTALRYRDGIFVTLRLRAGMYHRFHAPDDCRVRRVTYIAGDTWNVNPIALRRIERLFCRNERAVLALELDDARHALALVPVAAILVGGIHLRCVDHALHLRYRGPSVFPCDARLRRGDELGHFESGSTIVLLATRGLSPTPRLAEGQIVRVGEPLLERVS
jgi:phosphatidylserine decarboxylase